MNSVFFWGAALIVGMLPSYATASCSSTSSKWSTLPTVEKVLNEPNDQERLGNMICLESFGAKAAPIFLKGLTDKSWEVRAISTRMIAMNKEIGKRALSPLIAAASDPDGRVRRGVLEALFSIDQEGKWVKRTMPVFLKASDDTDPEVRRIADQSIMELSRGRPDISLKEYWANKSAIPPNKALQAPAGAEERGRK